MSERKEKEEEEQKRRRGGSGGGAARGGGRVGGREERVKGGTKCRFSYFESTKEICTTRERDPNSYHEATSDAIGGGRKVEGDGGRWR